MVLGGEKGLVREDIANGMFLKHDSEFKYSTRVNESKTDIAECHSGWSMPLVLL